jgi:serine/threonine-protein kinase
VTLLHAIERCLPDGFLIQDRLGGGATSWVYLAERAVDGERLVVKVLHPALVKRDSADRFVREIAVMQKLSHPRIIPILQPGEADGALFFTMPFFGRETLRHRLQAGGPMPVRDALLVARDVAQALGFAHKHGVVHRDVKPENILLGDDGSAYLMDFGFANAPTLMSQHEASVDSRLVIGTPGYVSPEQVTGKRADDWRGDFYSLGAVMFEMLTGQLPHAAGEPTRAGMLRQIEERAPDIRTLRPDCPDAVASMVRRNLERSPNDRYATAFHFQMAIEAALEALGALPALQPSA